MQLVAAWPGVVLRAGRVLERRGDRERAIAVYRRALTTLDTSEAHDAMKTAVQEQLGRLDGER
jgi:hypothetical protein